MNFNIANKDEIPSFAKWYCQNFSQHKLHCFEAEMGVGKTTLISAICTEMGVIDELSSPTYSIINEYHLKNNSKLFHMDLYRLRSIDEALNIGIEDYIFGENICFIEWPGLIKPMLNVNHLEINIVLSENDGRIVTVEEKQPMQ